MIYTKPQRRITGLYLEDYSAPTADFLAARLEESSIRTPGASIDRMREVSRAEGVPEELAEINRETMPGFFVPEALKREEPLSPVLSPEEATARGKSLGLTFSKPTRSEVVDLLIERKKREVALQAVTQRSPSVTASALGFGMDLLGQATDPMNIAAAFVPVVREARFLAWARASGPAAARLGRGVVEGVAGAALVEPFILAAAEQEQADYNMMDSLLNIAFGGVLGGGFHTAGGAISDAVARRFGGRTLSERLQVVEPEVREQALRTAVAQALEGRAVNVEPVLSGSRFLDTTSLSTRNVVYQSDAVSEAPGLRAETPEPTEQPSVAEVSRDTLVPYQPLSRRRQFFDDEEKAHAAARNAGPDVRVVRQEDGRYTLAKSSQAEPLRDPHGRVRLFRTQRQAQKYIERSARARKDDLDIVPFGPQGRREFAIVQGATKQEVKAISDAPDRVRFPDRSQDQFRSLGTASPVAPRQEPSLQERIEKAVGHSRDPRQVMVADFRIAEEAETQFKAIPKVDDEETANTLVDDARELAEEVKERLGISDDVFARVTEEADVEIAKAEALGRAARAAALCDLRR